MTSMNRTGFYLRCPRAPVVKAVELRTLHSMLRKAMHRTEKCFYVRLRTL